jgi:hypothetical protein
LSEKADHVLANMEQLGAQTVRELISSGRWPANYSALAKEWLHQKDMEEGDRKEAHSEAPTLGGTKEREFKDADGEAPMFLVRRSNEVAHSAREAALFANKRAEDANKHAEDADKRAESANAIARQAKNIACAAATSVDQSASAAKTAKRIAIAALVAALIAIAIPIAVLFIRWPPALQTLLNIMWQR